MSVALIVDDLTLAYPRGGGIHGVTFTAADRAVTAVIGANGAGKTVLFSVVAGLCTPQAGAVAFAIEDARVAYCPDIPQFEPWLTASEVVQTSLALAQRATRTSGVDATRRAAAALDACGLGAVARRRIADFSRGMLQRLGIAAALVSDPEVLILDEPQSALDPVGRADMRALILAEGKNRCVLLSSHLLSEVELLADHVVVLDKGAVVANGTPAELLRAGRRPVWTVRFDAPVPAGRTLPRLEDSHVGLAREAADTVTLTFPSFAEAADRLLPCVQALGLPVLEITLRDDDLDSTFARLVGEVSA